MNALPATIRTPVRLLQCMAMAVLALSITACASTEKTGKHLFILSGQSNMTGSVKAGFTERVHEQYGEENVVVVMRMKSGRGIRFWVPDYVFPDERTSPSNGEEYPPLIETALAAEQEQDFDTVGLIWMQGESDANNRLSEVYEESFVKLINQLKTDLDRDDLYFVIGRINDYAKSRPDNEHWHSVRSTQMRLGNTPGNAWIDTDDLNDGNPDRPDDLHFPKEGALAVGQRFADKAIELIEKQ